MDIKLKSRFAKTLFYNFFRYGKQAENAYGLESNMMFLTLSYRICSLCLLRMVLLN